VGNAADLPQLQLNLSNSRPRLGLTAEPVAPLAGTRYRLQLESSEDLRRWTAERVVEPDPLDLGLPGVDAATPYRFYRLQAEVEETGSAADGAEFFGYDRIFREELRRVGFLTPEAFAEAHDLTGRYLEQITFDPRAAKWWENFRTNQWGKLTGAELDLFLKHGFVVQDGRAKAGWSLTFAAVYHSILSADLPVFLSADAMLHAWHFSYQRLLEEAEETQLSPALQNLLGAMQSQLLGVSALLSNGPLAASVRDAEYLLGVASRLLNSSSGFGDDFDLSRTLRAIESLQFESAFPMFGTVRAVDFSQFKVRGHYEKSDYLARYFRAMMWLARADLRIFTQPGDPQSLRELGTALVLGQLLQNSGRTESWRQLDALIGFLVGRADAMDFPQLERLMAAAGVRSLGDIATLDHLAEIQARLREGGYGTQWYAGDVYGSPFGPEQTQLPRVFALIAQRFVADGWALAQVTFDRVLWNEEIPGVTWFQKVLRRHPSALDVAYSTFGNRPVGELIAERMLDRAAAAGFRDGYPYAHNLTALAATFDRLDATAWEDSLYARWLAALRLLSLPTTGPEYPEAMRTKAWVWRTLNTQLASYTELKHDTVLYAKQPYAGNILCEYPTGFVEPVPEFWRAMQRMAEAAAAGFGAVPAGGSITFKPDGWTPIRVNLAQRQSARIAFCLNFAAHMEKLAVLSEKELRQQPFTGTEIAFIRGLMNNWEQAYGGATFDGWYPGLFYEDYQQESEPVANANGSNQSDPLITDIHTATPDQVDPRGGVLHEATGGVDVLLIAVDNGPDRMVYAGPVLSHYEFIQPGPQMRRLSDTEWSNRLSSQPPARPAWTRSYMAPR
jgi:hypothetical protein